MNTSSINAGARVRGPHIFNTIFRLRVSSIERRAECGWVFRVFGGEITLGADFICGGVDSRAVWCVTR